MGICIWLTFVTPPSSDKTDDRVNYQSIAIILTCGLLNDFPSVIFFGFHFITQLFFHQNLCISIHLLLQKVSSGKNARVPKPIEKIIREQNLKFRLITL